MNITCDLVTFMHSQIKHLRKQYVCRTYHWPRLLASHESLPKLRLQETLSLIISNLVSTDVSRPILRRNFNLHSHLKHNNFNWPIEPETKLVCLQQPTLASSKNRNIFKRIHLNLIELQRIYQIMIVLLNLAGHQFIFEHQQ